MSKHCPLFYIEDIPRAKTANLGVPHTTNTQRQPVYLWWITIANPLFSLEIYYSPSQWTNTYIRPVQVNLYSSVQVPCHRRVNASPNTLFGVRYTVVVTEAEILHTHRLVLHCSWWIPIVDTEIGLILLNLHGLCGVSETLVACGSSIQGNMT